MKDGSYGMLEQCRAGVAWVLLGGCLAACGGSGAVGPGKPGELTRRDTKVTHQACATDSSDAQKIDVNSDGKPDVMIVQSGSREVCRAVDLNFDGSIDAYVYRDGGGQVSRRESDYDRDGRVDEVSIYKAGVLVERHRATTLTGKLDTWHFYQAGKLARTERDSDGDAVVDQWWEYPKPDSPECPLIHSDVDGDGRPDPGATVDVCGQESGYVPPERDQNTGPKGPTFDRGAGTDVPTEVDQKPMDSPPPPGAAQGESK